MAEGPGVTAQRNVEALPRRLDQRAAALGPMTAEEAERYSRQILLNEVGRQGQERLRAARVLVVGAGGLGSPASLYLAAAGVGTIGLVDGGRVDRSNLQRQILHSPQDVGRPKVESGAASLRRLNPWIQVDEHKTVLSSENALQILGGYDVVINGCDNFPTRYLVNDACVLLGLPLVDASVLRWDGMAAVFVPGGGCYRCLYPSPPPPGSVPSCAEAGVMGAMVGHLGTLQALETIKLLLGVGRTLTSRLLLFDGFETDYHMLEYARNPNCPVCGEHPSIRQLVDYAEFCGVPTPEDEVNRGQPFEEMAADEASRRLAAGEPIVVLDVREADEYASGHIAGARWLPLGRLRAATDQEEISELAPETAIVTVCRTGQRSAEAARLLTERGWSSVYNLRGGMVAWQGSGLPVVEGPAGGGRD